MFSMIIVDEHDEVQSGITNHRRGLTVRDVQNLCTARGLRHVTIGCVGSLPSQKELNHWIEQGVDTLIVDQG